ncbi:MAG: hypothetical protein E3K32_04170 [wastewater metagenome]|nr:hypothetical protein [Candidatus Loosdrechtia aerotolerans]
MLFLQNYITGYLAKDIDEFVKKVSYLLEHREERQEMGKRGHEFIRENFLVPRLVREEIGLYRELA